MSHQIANVEQVSRQISDTGIKYFRQDIHAPLPAEYTVDTPARSSSVEQRTFKTHRCILTATEQRHLKMTAGNLCDST